MKKTHLSELTISSDGTSIGTMIKFYDEPVGCVQKASLNLNTLDDEEPSFPLITLDILPGGFDITCNAKIINYKYDISTKKWIDVDDIIYKNVRIYYNGGPTSTITNNDIVIEDTSDNTRISCVTKCEWSVSANGDTFCELHRYNMESVQLNLDTDIGHYIEQIPGEPNRY